MPWIDDGNGGWMWQPTAAETVSGNMPPQPSRQPPSALMSSFAGASQQPSAFGGARSPPSLYETQAPQQELAPTAFQMPPIAPAQQPLGNPPLPAGTQRLGTSQQAYSAPQTPQSQQTSGGTFNGSAGAYQGDFAPAPPPDPTLLTPEEEALLAAGGTGNVPGNSQYGKTYENIEQLRRQRERGSYDPNDINVVQDIVAKKAGLKPGAVTWSPQLGAFVFDGGSGPVVVADAKGNLNPSGVEGARAVGLGSEPAIADTYAPDLFATEAKGAEAINDERANAQQVVDSTLQRIEEAGNLDTTQSDEARQTQRDILALQQSVIDRILDFDAEAYAQMFADQSLSALNAQARSARGGQGAVSAALYGAQAQAPDLMARGAQQAAGLESERLQAAGNVAAQAAGTAGDVRAGDLNQQKLKADLAVSVMNGITELTGLDLQLDARAQEHIADLGLEFAQVYQQYVGMDLQRQLAQWDNWIQKYGVDQQTKVALEQVKAQLESGKIGWDDVGLALLETGGRVVAAKVGGGKA